MPGKERANTLATVALAITLLGNLLGGAYYYGRISERVDAIDRNTQLLLRHVLSQGERASQ